MFFTHIKKPTTYYPSRPFGLKRSDFSRQKRLKKPLTTKTMNHTCQWTYCHVTYDQASHFHQGGRQAIEEAGAVLLEKLVPPLLLVLT